MLAYNVEPYIAAAIEGVLRQKIAFPIELVIGEDCSKDNTRAVCSAYAEKYPGIVRVLPATENLGIAGNAARTLEQCRGQYIAICDGDDVWSDPHKLAKQVQILELNADVGAVYTDVQTIDAEDVPFDDPEHREIRELYAGGDIFFKLLQGNFINNSTAVFRRRLLDGYHIDRDRNYYTHDHLLWLHVAIHSKIQFIAEQSTLYRKHRGGVTNSAEKLANNKKKFQYHLFGILQDFDRHYDRPVSAAERRLIFKKILSVLYRKENTPAMKFRALGMLPRYFPGFSSLANILLGKLGRKTATAPNHTVLTTNLKSNT